MTAHSHDARIVVYVRENCHLCEQAMTVVAQVAAEFGAEWVSVDIAPVPELVERFSDQVPVTFVDGRQHDFWRVDPIRLASALER